MAYTVKQLGSLAGVTPRTLHYYDQIGLLKPATVGENGYRYYGEDALLRLQQILFYRELGFSLDDIRAMLARPGFDLEQALRGHRQALVERVERLFTLIDTVDRTIQHLHGEITMSKRDFYAGFDEEKQKQRGEQARQRWGETDAYRQAKDWNAYTSEQKNDILAAMHDISAGIAANMDQGAESAEVQIWVTRWHQHINTYFYPCSLEIFESLGHMYPADPEFAASYEAVRPGLARFMEQAITYYVQVKRQQAQ